MTPLVQWQKVADESKDIIYPWFTHPFLEVLDTWDLSGKLILEFGAGRSTAWWRSKAKWVDTIEANNEWALAACTECNDKLMYNGRVYFSTIPDGRNRGPEYLSLIPKRAYQYDVIVVDGIYRTECMEWAVKYFQNSEHGGFIIADNWQQDYVWISPSAEKVMAPFEIHRYEQHDHTDHDGKKWNTSYWEIKPKQ